MHAPRRVEAQGKETVAETKGAFAKKETCTRLHDRTAQNMFHVGGAFSNARLSWEDVYSMDNARASLRFVSHPPKVIEDTAR